MKQCSKCKIVKLESEFGKTRSTKDGLNTICKECRNKNSQERYNKNKEATSAKLRERYGNDEQYRQRILNHRKKWVQNNPNKSKASSKKYCEINKEKINSKRRKRYDNDEQYRQRRIDRVKQWRLNNPERLKKSVKKHYESNKEKIIANNRKYQEKYPKRKKVQKTVERALKLGKIQRPKRCTNCNTKKPLDAHHEDYDKPLDVIWLCRSCHKHLHFAAIAEEVL